MPKLAFRPDADGFAFINRFQWDAIERGVLSALSTQVTPSVVAAILPDPVLAITASVAVASYVLVGSLDVYGLCGGMCYSALDYWRSRMILPRGAHDNDEPLRGAAGDSVRVMLWDRLLNSLMPGGVLATTLEWMLRLNVVPELAGGGAPWLMERTREEWQRLKGHIDNGEPWPIGLVGTTLSAWNQHQVLVYGYEDSPTTNRLFIYDPNAPHQYGETGDTTITLTFQSSGLTAVFPTATPAFGALRGFFCSGYAPAIPPTGLAIDFGLFVTGRDGIQVFMMTNGAKFAVASPDELSALGGSFNGVRSTSLPLARQPRSQDARPRDGTMLRESTTGPQVFLFQGGGAFLLPDALMELFGGVGAIRIVPDGTATAFSSIPVDGSLLREFSDPKVYRVESGQRRWVTTPGDLEPLGGFPSVRIVPDGGLAFLPEGSVIPAPRANECDTIASQIQRLEAQAAILEDFDDPDDPRANARNRAALLRIRVRIGELRRRAVVLGCP